VSVRQVTQKDRYGRPTTFWMIDFTYRHPDGRRERVRKVAEIQSRREAEAEERRLVAAVAGGTFARKEPTPEPAPAAAPLFKDFAAEFERTYVATNNKPSERETKASILRVHLVPAFGDLRLDALGPERVERYKALKLRGDPAAVPKRRPLAPKTINNHLTILHRLYAIAIEWGRIPAGVAPTIRWLDTPEPEFDFFDFDEAERLIAAAGAWRPVILVALHTGLRLGELLALRRQDVDLKAARLLVRRAVARGIVGTPKNGKKREVPLSERALATLQAHQHLRGELVFCADDGAMLTKGACKHPLWTACKRAGLRQVGWHVLRHTFASHLVMRGAPLKAIQELLGHATLEMTMRYAHLSPDARREAVRLLDGAGASRGKTAARQGGGRDGD
jgi:integrase